MGAAALRHGLHIPDTRRRVRRTATHCFHKGGMVQKLRYGYRKLTKEEAAAGDFGPKDLRTVKRPECTGGRLALHLVDYGASKTMELWSLSEPAENGQESRQ